MIYYQSVFRKKNYASDKEESSIFITKSMPLDEFRNAFAKFIQAFIGDQTLLAAAVDGKTARQSFDKNGDPEHIINIFIHDCKLAVTQFSTNELKTNEPGCLKEHFDEVMQQYGVEFHACSG